MYRAGHRIEQEPGQRRGVIEGVSGDTAPCTVAVETADHAAQAGRVEGHFGRRCLVPVDGPGQDPVPSDQVLHEHRVVGYELLYLLQRNRWRAGAPSAK